MLLDLTSMLLAFCFVLLPYACMQANIALKGGGGSVLDGERQGGREEGEGQQTTIPLPRPLLLLLLLLIPPLLLLLLLIMFLLFLLVLACSRAAATAATTAAAAAAATATACSY